MNFNDLMINNKQELIEAIKCFGILPFFCNSIPGFSIEEHISRECWYTSSDGSWQAWDWKGPVIKETGCAYGKFFEHKAAYVSSEWFAELANYRRDGYDADARYADGLLKHTDNTLYEMIDANAPVMSKTLKKLGDYRKGGNKGFDTSVTRLQALCYVVVSDFVYQYDKNGNRYGWGIAEYSTPERTMGSDFTDRVYKREPEESYELLFRHLKELFPRVSDETIKRFLG